MKAHRSSRRATDTNIGRRAGKAIVGKSPVNPSVVTVRKLQATPVPEGYTKCGQCGRVVKDRADGSMRAHRSQGVIPCIAAEPSLPGDVARRAREGYTK